ncbi:Uu.00g108280.m01.CDS01 [Anthostomella pinea]|uniref:Uu.00g108280.m01.CDS01 n=1 Tax=Anthostomella pinea TaxID=933095 RepID=A0AAI8YG29_9PEZI|nr:Uu.00g108280.m01.CDS01 [Anthostomella pinea]
MPNAKDAIKGFMSRSGQHTTTVHETAAPAVQHEVVKPTQHEEVNTALDKEVHQDHYHHKVQPVQDREVLPEQHTHNVAAVEHRDFDHRDNDKTRQALEAEAAKFKDERVIQETARSQSHAAAVQGEHVHHHVHETVQPVVHKETIQPSVVHTAVPIHETHHNAAKHHATSTLPPVNMSEYKKQGGALGGKEERFGSFEGEPSVQSSSIGGATGTHRTETPVRGTSHGDFNPLDAGREHEVGGFRRAGEGGMAGAGMNDMRKERGYGQEYGHERNDSGKGLDSPTGERKQPGLMDKLNPKVDADGDGVAGFMK